MLYFFAIILQNVLVSQNAGGAKFGGAKCEAQSVLAQSLGHKV